MRFSLLFLGVLLTVNSAWAQGIPVPEIRSGLDLNEASVMSSLADVREGTVIVLGEQHGTEVHQAYQLMVLQTLRDRGFAVSVGMEFLEHPQQHGVDRYRAGTLSESDFLSQIQWGGFPFQNYRAQILFPAVTERTVALNVPREVTSRIAKLGLPGVSAADRAHLPTDFESKGRGNDLYFERFKTAMSGHITDPKKLENYFLAQSAWDDTMAWQANEHVQAHPKEVLVILVGEFHVQYGGGLPDRMRKRGVSHVVTVSMLNTKGWTEVEKDQAMTPAGPHGPRADWIWLAEF